MTPFNRAMLFNIGYKEALKIRDFNCFVFHDVDLIPEDDRNYYGCAPRPRHLSVAVDTFRYKYVVFRDACCWTLCRENENCLKLLELHYSLVPFNLSDCHMHRSLEVLGRFEKNISRKLTVFRTNFGAGVVRTMICTRGSINVAIVEMNALS